jgi:hypothetical protein
MLKSSTTATESHLIERYCLAANDNGVPSPPDPSRTLRGGVVLEEPLAPSGAAVLATHFCRRSPSVGAAIESRADLTAA